MNLEQSVTLVDYHCWARDRILDAVRPLTHEQYTRDMGNSFRSIPWFTSTAQISCGTNDGAEALPELWPIPQGSLMCPRCVARGRTWDACTGSMSRSSAKTESAGCSTTTF